MDQDGSDRLVLDEPIGRPLADGRSLGVELALGSDVEVTVVAAGTAPTAPTEWVLDATGETVRWIEVGELRGEGDPAD